MLTDAYNTLQEEDLNDYERQRAEQIARNKARLKELNLLTLAAEVAPHPKAPTAMRGLKAKRKQVNTCINTNVTVHFTLEVMLMMPVALVDY